MLQISRDETIDDESDAAWESFPTCVSWGQTRHLSEVAWISVSLEPLVVRFDSFLLVVLMILFALWWETLLAPELRLLPVSRITIALQFWALLGRGHTYTISYGCGALQCSTNRWISVKVECAAPALPSNLFRHAAPKRLNMLACTLHSSWFCPHS